VGSPPDGESVRVFVSNIIVRSVIRAIPQVVYLHVACCEKIVSDPVHSVVVDGARVSYSLEGTGAVNVVLVHGFAAHRQWWDWVVPELLRDFRILRVDLSGHGESDHRNRYSIETWGTEVVAAALAAFGDGPTFLVGHSLGGRVVIASGRHPELAASGVLVLDTSFPDPELPRVPSQWKPVQRLYESREAAMERFRLVPPQPIDPTILRTLAGHSVRAVEGGWTWRHDFRLNPTELQFPPIADLGVPVRVAYGEESSVVDAPTAYRMAELVGDGTTVVSIPRAHHHLVLDAPEAVAAAITALARHDQTTD